jgi:hypothetical protein
VKVETREGEEDEQRVYLYPPFRRNGSRRSNMPVNCRREGKRNLKSREEVE